MPNYIGIISELEVFFNIVTIEVPRKLRDNR
jgi:hypothetical protein